MIGEVGIRNVKTNFSFEKKLYDYSSILCKENINDSNLSILSLIVESGNEYEADNIAEQKIVEALDIYNPFRNIKLYETGYLKTLDDKFFYVRKKREISNLGVMFKNIFTWIPLCEFHDFIFLLPNSELKECYLRFKHWENKSWQETDYQLKLIYLWFGLEAIIKLHDESIVDMLQKGLGFLIGNLGRNLTEEERNNIINQDKEKYKIARNNSKKIFERIREERVKIVHEAHKKWEYNGNSKYDYEILMMSSSRLDNYVKEALKKNIETKKDFLDEFTKLYKENKNLLEELYGTVIHFLLKDEVIENEIILEKYDKSKSD